MADALEQPQDDEKERHGKVAGRSDPDTVD
jgi:hypothetical protein